MGFCGRRWKWHSDYCLQIITISLIVNIVIIHHNPITPILFINSKPNLPIKNFLIRIFI